MDITQSSDIKELLSKLLVTKNKLALIKSYYQNLNDSLSGDLKKLLTDLTNELTWMDSQVGVIQAAHTNMETAVNNFTAKASGADIVNHAKYIEMLQLYNKYISEFYDRMTTLESTYENSFINSDFSKINSSWKFHYGDDISDASSMIHDFSSVNFTKDSDIIEVSDGRYIYRTENNYIIDADYKSKNCYITTLDNKTIFNKYVAKSGSTNGFYGEESAKIVKLFQVKGKPEVLVLIDLYTVNDDSELRDVGDIVGEPSDGITHVLVVAKYDYDTRSVSLLLPFDANTSLLLIKDKVLKSKKINFVYEPYTDFYYYIIGSYFVRIKILGSINEKLNQEILISTNIDICAAVISGRKLLIPISDKQINLHYLDKTIDTSNPDGSFTTTSKQSLWEEGEQGVVCNIIYTRYAGVFIITDKSIWNTKESSSNEYLTIVTKDNRTSNVASTNLKYNNKDMYTFDDNGTFYYLEDGERVFSLNLDGTKAMSPTRQSDKLFFIKSDPTAPKNTIGYVHNRPNDDPDKQEGTVLNGKNVYKSFTYKDHYVAISTEGVVSRCNIKTGKWLSNINPIITGKEIIGYYEDENEIYLTTNVGSSTPGIYTITKEKLIASDLDVQAEKLVTADLGSVFAMAKYRNTLYLGGYSGRVSAFNLKTKVLYRYDSEKTEDSECIDNGLAIGNKNIRAMAVVGNILVIMGNNGYVASCNLVSKIWTSFQGLPIGGDKIDSKIYNNGSATNSEDINTCINYLNEKLVVMSNRGKIASCDASTGNWNDCNSKKALSNDGDIIKNKGNITSSIRINDIVVIGTNTGKLASFNLSTGGMTDVDGLDLNVNIPGPKIHYTGEDFTSINTLAVDIIKGLLIFAGNEANISTYSIIERIVMRPDISKLYYVGRNLNENDYLSSLLVQIDLISLLEYRALEPPREIESVYSNSLNNTFYTYKNGKFVYSVSNDFRQLLKSTDDGLTTEVITLPNTEWIPDGTSSNKSAKLVVDEPRGFVTSDGEFGFFVEVNKTPHFLFTSKDNDISKASWYIPSTYNAERVIKDFELITNDKESLFYIKVENTQHKLIPGLVKFSSNNLMVDFDFSYKLDDTELINETRNIFFNMDKDGRLIVSSDYNLNITEYTLERFYLNPTLSSIIPTKKLIIDNDNNFFNKYFTNRESIGYLPENGGKFLGSYIIDNYIYNYIFGDAKTGNVDVLNVIVYKKDNTLDVSSKQVLTARNTWDIIDNIIKPSQFIPILGNTRYTKDTDVSLSDITFKPKYLTSFKNGYKTILGVDVSYEKYHSEVISKNGGFTQSHVIFNLDSDTFGKYISPNYRVFKAIENKGQLICDDPYSNEILLCEYSRRDEYNRIRHTNLVHRFKIEDSATYAPLRSLQEPWYSTQMYLSNDVNAFTIKCKFKVIGDDKEIDTVIKQEAIRYQVLISSEKTGKFILYEVEKSPIMSRLDRETKTFCPLFKVKSIDRFDGRITELYTSRLAGRQSAFYRVQPNDIHYPDNYSVKNAMTYDFISYVDMSRVIEENDTVSVRIRPMNNLPSNIDAQFMIETYTLPKTDDVSLRTESVKSGFNNIERSEYKDEFSYSGLSLINIGIPNESGFLEKSSPDIVTKTDKLHTFNNDDLPQVEGIPLGLERGKADTYCVRFIGNGDGTFNETNGIIMHIGNGEWKYTPYSVNKKRILYEFDYKGSKEIARKFNLKYAKAGRNLYKMHNFGVYAKSVINNADYYTSYEEGKSRIAKSEGLFATYSGLYEVVSTFDGYQRRINKVLESNENGLYRYANNGYDAIKPREFGMSYDIVDRFSIFELPYYYNQSWWIPAKGYITRGNESLLTFDADESEVHYRNIGRYRLPFSDITTPEIEIGGSSGDEGGGIGSGGQAYDPNKVAYSILLRKKYPLEHWDHFNDLDFVYEWKDIYTDRTEKHRWVVEKPKDEGTLNTTFITYDKIPENVTESLPTVPRNLYNYKDNFDYERRGTQEFRYMTGYYYDSQNWKIYKHEIVTDVYGYDSKYNGIDENYTEDKNLSKRLSNTIDEYAWYVPVNNDHNNNNYFRDLYTDIRNTVKPAGTEHWPRGKREIVGEMVTGRTYPIPDLVAISDGTAAYTNFDKHDNHTYPTGKIQVYRRNKLEQAISPDSSITNSFMFVLVTADDENVLTTSKKGINDSMDTSKLVSELSKASGNTVVIGASNVNGHLDDTLIKSLNRFNVNYTLAGGRLPRIFNGYLPKSGSVSSQFAFTGKENGYPSQGNTSPISIGYDNNVGLIYPFKFSNKSWNVSNWNTPFTATSIRYYGDCSTSDQPLEIKIAEGTKYYDRYAGGDQRRYQYGTEETISYSLKGMTPRTHSRMYYKYTTEIPAGGDSSTSPSGYTKITPVYWDRRVPTKNKQHVLIDKEYLGCINPSYPGNPGVGGTPPNEIFKSYKFRYFYDDGTCEEKTESYKYEYCWIYIPDSSSASQPNNAFTPVGIDNSSIRDCKIACVEFYKWSDGHIVNNAYLNDWHTLAHLNDKWNVTSSLNITNSNNGVNYLKNYDVTFVGPSLTTQNWISANQTRKVKRVDKVLYAATVSDPGKAGTAAIRWELPTGKNS